MKNDRAGSIGRGASAGGGGSSVTEAEARRRMKALGLPVTPATLEWFCRTGGLTEATLPAPLSKPQQRTRDEASDEAKAEKDDTIPGRQRIDAAGHSKRVSSPIPLTSEVAVSEVADLVGIHRVTASEVLRRRHVPTRRDGRERRASVAALVDALDAPPPATDPRDIRSRMAALRRAGHLAPTDM